MKNKSAFPQETGVGNIYRVEDGLTKREYLAMDIYARTINASDSDGQLKSWAKHVVSAADILLEVLEEDNEEK